MYACLYVQCGKHVCLQYLSLHKYYASRCTCRTMKHAYLVTDQVELRRMHFSWQQVELVHQPCNPIINTPILMCAVNTLDNRYWIVLTNKSKVIIEHTIIHLHTFSLRLEINWQDIHEAASFAKRALLRFPRLVVSTSALCIFSSVKLVHLISALHSCTNTIHINKVDHLRNCSCAK